MHPVIRDVAAAHKAKVIKIDVDKPGISWGFAYKGTLTYDLQSWANDLETIRRARREYH
jgi:hypothetical protein